MARVFISYRRADCAGHAGRLYDHLVERFGDNSVFMDIDAIEPGVDFGERIEKAVGSCSVLIALIGDEWLDIADSAGRRRLDSPTDLVRSEIAGALRRSDLRVIPVLVEGAAMPLPEQLPDELKPLARRNALELSDARWRYDADRLIEVVERVAPTRRGTSSFGAFGGRGERRRIGASPAAAARTPNRFPTAAVAVAGAIVAIVAVGAIVLLGGGGDSGGGVKRGGAVNRGAGVGSGTPVAHKRRSLVLDAKIPLVSRPNALAFSGNDVVVLGPHKGDLGFVDAATGKENGPRVEDLGGGASDVASGFGSLWVAKHTEGSLIRIDPRPRRRAGSAIKLGSGMLVAVATGGGAVWVGSQQKGGPSQVVKVTPQGQVARTIPVVGRIYDVAVGRGAVWVTTTSPGTVVRISLRDGKLRTIPVGGDPHGLAIGAGAVWVANSGDKSVTRINSKTGQINRSIQLGVAPERVAVGRGFVWVTAQSANKLIRINPRSLKVQGRLDDIGVEPYAVGVHRGDVWVTLAGENAIRRVRFAR
jgi:hypothetical protein